MTPCPAKCQATVTSEPPCFACLPVSPILFVSIRIRWRDGSLLCPSTLKLQACYGALSLLQGALRGPEENHGGHRGSGGSSEPEARGRGAQLVGEGMDRQLQDVIGANFTRARKKGFCRHLH